MPGQKQTGEPYSSHFKTFILVISISFSAVVENKANYPVAENSMQLYSGPLPTGFNNKGRLR